MEDQEYFDDRYDQIPRRSERESDQDYNNYQDIRTLLTWNAEGRPFKKRKKEYFINIAILMLPILIILFLFSQYLLMLVVVALVFVNYALKTVPPEKFHYRLSTEGLSINEHFYLWRELYDFYLKHYEDQNVIIVRTRAMFPGELTITIGDMHVEQIKSVILRYLPFREHVEQTFMEKMGQKLSSSIPLEKSPHSPTKSDAAI